MGGGDEDAADEVLVPRLHPHPTPAAPLLGPVARDRCALDVAGMGDGDGHVLLGDQVLHRDLVHRVHDLRPAGVPVLFADLLELLAHDGVHAPGGGQDVLEVRDGDADLLELVDDLLALQPRQALELQPQDLLRLDLAEAEAVEKAGLGLLGAPGPADEGDHLVQVVEGDGEALQDVGPRLRLAQVVGGAPPHHLATEVEEELAGLEQVQDAGPLVDDGQEDHPEGVLEGGVLVEVVEEDLGGLPLLHVDHDAHPLAVALVADPVLLDPLDPLLPVQLGDLLDEPCLVDLVGDLGDHDGLAVPLPGLDLRLGPHDDGPAAGPIGLANPGAAQDEAGGGEVGAGDALDHALQALVGGQVLVVEEEGQGVHDLTQVVGRDLGGHAHRDPLRPVHDQVREHGREHGRLHRAVVVGGDEVDGLLLDVRHHRGAQAGEAGLGVAHGRGRVAVHGAEVALPVHQGGAHVPVLGHAHEGVVDGALAVGMVVAHHLPRDLGALPVGSAGLQAHLLHAVEDAAVRGLEAVPHVGQGAADDHGHRVVHVGLAHLVRDVGGDPLLGDRFVGHARCPGCGRSGRSPR